MAYERPKAVVPRPTDKVLTRRLAGLGFAFTASPDRSADIEESLVHASELGMDEGDLRVLSVLTTWIEVHRRVLCVDRLWRLLQEHPSERVRAFWASVSRGDDWGGQLARLHRGARIDLLEAGTDFQMRRRGQDGRFDEDVLRVPAGTLRDRPSDVATPEVLAPVHRGYALRVMLGASYRAVLWDLLESEPELSPSEAGRRARSSFSTAWEAVRDFRVVHGQSAAAERRA